MGDRAALCTAEGVLYRDGSGRRWLDPTKPETLRYITDLAKECARLGFDEILLDWFLYPTSGDQTALDLPADRTGVLKDFAQALEKQLPEGTVLSVVLRETPAADNGLTPEMLTACFDRVYVMPEADASALPTSYDAATGELQFNANSSQVIDIPTYIRSLQSCGVFSTVSYTGYNADDDGYSIDLRCVLAAPQ